MPTYQTNEWNDEIRAIVEDVKVKAKLSKEAVFRELDRFGASYDVLRHAYYRRRASDQALTDRVKYAAGKFLEEFEGKTSDQAVIAVLESNLRRSGASLTVLQKAVTRMCLACAGEMEVKLATCWDGTCPLRPASPLPLRKAGVSSAVPFVAEDLGRE